METRTVKFNLKDFIESYIYFHELVDREGKKNLLESFDKYYYSCDYNIRISIQRFLFNNTLARQYPDLQSIATRCEANF